MKFSEVKIGARFKINISSYVYIKINNTCSSFNMLNDNFFAFFDSDYEVELISKCANCKWYDRNWKNLECETDDDRDDHCHKLGIHICGDEYYCLNVDKETFSCSNFETKGE